jgi:hypothetical protein
MKTDCFLLFIAAACTLAAMPTATGQVVANPPVPGSSAVSQVGADLAALLKSKQELGQLLGDLYRLDHNVMERGRIWAKTKDEWTDIRVVESNLNKAANHYAAGERHWEAGRFTQWHREWLQAAEAMKRSRPQVSRIERMIRVRRGG